MPIMRSQYLPANTLVTVRLRNATLREIATEVSGRYMTMEFVATPESLVLTPSGFGDPACHVVREYQVGDILARGEVPVPKSRVNYTERTSWPKANLLSPERRSLAQTIWNDWRRQPSQAALIGDRLIIRDTLAGQRKFRQLLDDVRAGIAVDERGHWSPRDAETLRRDTQLEGWYSISHEKCFHHLNKIVAEFEVKNVSVEVALWALFSKADVPYVINNGDRDQQDILRCPTTVYAQNSRVQDICYQILMGTALHRDPPWLEASFVFEVRDEVVRFGVSKHRAVITPSGMFP